MSQSKVVLGDAAHSFWAWEELLCLEVPECPKPGSWECPSHSRLTLLSRICFTGTISNVFKGKHFKCGGVIQTLVCDPNVPANVFSDWGCKCLQTIWAGKLQ